MFANGGIQLEHCAVSDYGVRCAIEYNYVRWEILELSPQAGVATYESGSSGRLAAGHIYDVEPPATSDSSSEEA